MEREKLIQRLIEEVAEYIAELEDHYQLSDKEVVKILDSVKEAYEWED